MPPARGHAHDLSSEGRRRPRALTALARRYDAAGSLAGSRSGNARGQWQDVTASSHADPELPPARKGKGSGPWPELPPQEAFDAGVPLGVVPDQGIRTALHRSLAGRIRRPVPGALAGGRRVPVCWYGQHDPGSCSC